MQDPTFTQLQQAVEQNDAFAATIMGMYLLDNGTSQEDIKAGCDLLAFAGEGKNCIWAKNVLFALRGIPFRQPFSKQILVENDALEQLRIYASQDNIWAMTALGNLLYTGYSNPQNREEGAKYLNMAADRQCLLAAELIADYGIKRQSQPTFGKLYDALKNKDYSKFWLK